MDLVLSCDQEAVDTTTVPPDQLAVGVLLTLGLFAGIYLYWKKGQVDKRGRLSQSISGRRRFSRFDVRRTKDNYED